MAMNRIRRVVAYAFAAAALTAGAATAAAGTANADGARPASDNPRGCPEGAVCIYAPGDWDKYKPEHVYWSYGVHKLHNEHGVHAIYNNQVGKTSVQLCENANGTDCSQHINTYGVRHWDLSPMNSLRNNNR